MINLLFFPNGGVSIMARTREFDEAKVLEAKNAIILGEGI